ncbi:hypothetical protein L6452_32205 [Arctium lappa]|uniref:Uncharacterized protein n=1 Tax=Arctium lappa TaxID=4217 RepID=A0ACB8Z3V3_ARCLA|nr:hypothetical protein L6452_32205 [Arctium lappa]
MLGMDVHGIWEGREWGIVLPSIHNTPSTSRSLLGFETRADLDLDRWSDELFKLNKTFVMKCIAISIQDLLSRAAIEVNPSNLDIIIRIEGRRMRKIFKAIPERTPWMKDFTNFTSKKLGKKGAAFTIPSIFASDCTNAIGITKKNVRKKKATTITSLLIVSETNGMARLSQ